MTSATSNEPNRTATSKLPFCSMLKELFGLGCIGFGGGSALIPVFKERLVDTGKVREEEFESAVAVACITPGALPVELASGIGLKAHGVAGALAAAGAFALPGVALMFTALAVLAQSSDAVLDQVAYLAVGTSGYIMSVIFRYIAGTLRRGSSAKGRALLCALIAAVFALTCGKALLCLLGAQDVQVLVCLGTVDVMGLAFFAAIWIGPKRTPARIASGAATVVLYCLLHSSPLSASETAKMLGYVLVAAMLVMAAVSLAQDMRSGKGRRTGQQASELLKALGAFAAVIAVALLAASLASDNGIAFIANGVLSSILSFGGGDAYIAMADGLFADGGIVSKDDFYGIVVPVSNALPGSILCKVLVGCGFTAGLEAPGIMTAALVLGLAGFAVAVAMSCATFAAGSFLLGLLKGSASFNAIERSVGCVVSGLLLTVSLGLLQMSITSAPTTASPAFAIAFPIAISALNAYAKQRFNIPAPAAVILSAAASALAFNQL